MMYLTAKSPTLAWLPTALTCLLAGMAIVEIAYQPSPTPESTALPTRTPTPRVTTPGPTPTPLPGGTGNLR